MPSHKLHLFDDMAPKRITSFLYFHTASRCVKSAFHILKIACGLNSVERFQVLSWIDICAGLAAKSVAGGPCVTASVDTVHFLSPCHLGSVCIVAAMVNRTFASSMEVCCCACLLHK